jgi:hypothetical protein
MSDPDKTQHCAECERLARNVEELEGKVEDAAQKRIDLTTAFVEEEYRIRMERDQLAAQNFAMRAELDVARIGAGSMGWSSETRISKLLALPDLATDILRRRDAETLRKSSDWFHCLAKSGLHDGVKLSEEAINACMYARIQLNGMAAELEKS